MMRMAKRARICFANCSEMGVSRTRPLDTGLMVTAKGFCSTKFKKCVAGYRNTERINSPACKALRHATAAPIVFYSQILPRCTARHLHGHLRCTCVTCAVQCLYLYSACTCALPALQRVSFVCCTTPHPAALPRTIICALHSPFWGQKPVIVLYRGYILSAGVFGQKKSWQKSALEIIISSQTNFGTSPHPTGTKFKAEPCVFMHSIMA